MIQLKKETDRLTEKHEDRQRTHLLDNHPETTTSQSLRQTGQDLKTGEGREGSGRQRRHHGQLTVLLHVTQRPQTKAPVLS